MSRKIPALVLHESAVSTETALSLVADANPAKMYHGPAQDSGKYVLGLARSAPPEVHLQGSATGSIDKTR